jgi:hypothetical protein
MDKFIIDPINGKKIIVPIYHGWVTPKNFRVEHTKPKNEASSEWKIKIYHHERALLVKDETYDICTYDGINNKVRNSAGISMTCAGPEQYMIDNWRNVVSSLWHPAIKRTSTTCHLDNFPNIEWDDITKTYRDVKTLRTLEGFRAGADYSCNYYLNGFFKSVIISCQYCVTNERLLRDSMNLHWDYPELFIVPTDFVGSLIDH